MNSLTDGDAKRIARIQHCKERITALVAGLDDAGLHTAVPACPGWSVRDVVAHPRRWPTTRHADA